MAVPVKIQLVRLSRHNHRQYRHFVHQVWWIPRRLKALDYLRIWWRHRPVYRRGWAMPLSHGQAEKTISCMIVIFMLRSIVRRWTRRMVLINKLQDSWIFLNYCFGARIFYKAGLLFVYQFTRNVYLDCIYKNKLSDKMQNKFLIFFSLNKSSSL